MFGPCLLQTHSRRKFRWATGRAALHGRRRMAVRPVWSGEPRVCGGLFGGPMGTQNGAPPPRLIYHNHVWPQHAGSQGSFHGWGLMSQRTSMSRGVGRLDGQVLKVRLFWVGKEVIWKACPKTTKDVLPVFRVWVLRVDNRTSH